VNSCARRGSSPITHLALVLAVMMPQVACRIAAAQPQAASQAYNPAAVVAGICRQYAAAQHAFPYDTMYAQCMYARGYLVPGFTPSLDSPGYQGGWPGAQTHAGGGP
jgi:hypothetical protein